MHPSLGQLYKKCVPKNSTHLLVFRRPIHHPEENTSELPNHGRHVQNINTVLSSKGWELEDNPYNFVSIGEMLAMPPQKPPFQANIIEELQKGLQVELARGPYVVSLEKV